MSANLALEQSTVDVPTKESRAPVEVALDAALLVMKNGGTTITKIDTATGETSTVFRPNEAPWFAFERKNYLGAGVEVGTSGQKAVVYYRRDILRVKDIHLQVKPAEIKVPIDGGRLEINAGAYVEYRW